MNRGTAHQSNPLSAESAGSSTNPNRESAKPSAAKEDLLGFWGRIGSNVLLFVVAVLVATVAWLIFASTPVSQNHYIDPSKLQAVFLNSGQVYFGNIQALNQNYLVLTNIYYLQTNSSSTTPSSSSASNQNVSLVKLGCELHMPYDRMIVNDSQVTFWENLQSGGQVAKAIAQFQQQHPNGQQCSQVTNSTTTNLQNQPTSSTTTTK